MLTVPSSSPTQQVTNHMASFKVDVGVGGTSLPAVGEHTLVPVSVLGEDEAGPAQVQHRRPMGSFCGWFSSALQPSALTNPGQRPWRECQLGPVFRDLQLPAFAGFPRG